MPALFVLEGKVLAERADGSVVKFLYGRTFNVFEYLAFVPPAIRHPHHWFLHLDPHPFLEFLPEHHRPRLLDSKAFSRVYLRH